MDGIFHHDLTFSYSVMNYLQIGSVDLENKTLHLHYYHMSQEEDLSFEEAERRLLKFSKSNEIQLFNDKKLGMKSGNIRLKLEKLETTGKPYNTNDKDDEDAEDYKKVTSFEKDKQGSNNETGKRKREESGSESHDTVQTASSSENSLLSPESTMLKLPQFIRQELYKDYTQVKIEKKLHKLDKEKTVALIVEGYLKELEEQDVPETEYDICKCVMDGIVKYFDCYCETFLLYPEEERQFDEEQTKRKSKKTTSKKNDEDTIPASTIYGLHHLLRLFTILPKLLSRMPEGMTLRQSTKSLIYQKLEGFFGYLELFMQNVQ